MVFPIIVISKFPLPKNISSQSPTFSYPCAVCLVGLDHILSILINREFIYDIQDSEYK